MERDIENKLKEWFEDCLIYREILDIHEVLQKLKIPKERKTLQRIIRAIPLDKEVKN